MTRFEPGDVVAWSTWCGTNVARLVDVTDRGVMFRASDGHVDYHPTSFAVSAGDILARLRHASPAEVSAYAGAEVTR